jgi:ElaB/YqjD/DUF883 family membrane-anchored ribosome-binding protein
MGTLQSAFLGKHRFSAGRFRLSIWHKECSYMRSQIVMERAMAKLQNSDEETPVVKKGGKRVENDDLDVQEALENEMRGARTAEGFASSAHSAIDAMAEKVAPIEESLRRTAAQTREKAERGGAELRDQVGAAEDNVRAYMLERPLTAIGIAFGLGMLALALTSR